MFSVDRNVRFVVVLFFSMTLGAAALRWMEAPPREWPERTLMMAATNEHFEDLTIELAPADSAFTTDAYDCVIAANGEAVWQPFQSNLRMLILVDKTGGLSKLQAENVLKVLGNMSIHGQLALSRVFIDPASDPRLNPHAPSAAHDLLSLLVRKGVIR